MADDAKGNPEGKVHKKGEVGRELGVTGLRHFGGLVDEEFLVQLKGAKAIEVYREMEDNDPIVGACLTSIKLLARQVKWRVDPASNSKVDRDNAKFVTECMDDMSHTWEDTITEVLSMLAYGWSYHEIVYKLRKGPNMPGGERSKHDDGKIGWRKFPTRSQDTLKEWLFDDTGGVKGIIQLAPPAYKQVSIPIEKSLLFRPSIHKGNPEGRSVLRNAYRPWYFKKRIEEIEGIGVERDLAGIPTAFVDPAILADDASVEEQALLASITTLLREVRRDQAEGIIFPRAYDDEGHLLYDFQLLAGGGSRSFSTDQIITRYEQRIAMTMLADFLLLGQDKVGSFALSSNKTHLFGVALGAWLDAISEVFNRHAITRLLDVNKMAVDKGYPSIKHEDIEGPELGALGAYLSALAGIGVPLMPDDALENHLRGAAHLPPKSPEAARSQEQMQQQQQMAGGQAPGPYPDQADNAPPETEDNATAEEPG